jgi:hypothetical protein
VGGKIETWAISKPKVGFGVITIDFNRMILASSSTIKKSTRFSLFGFSAFFTRFFHHIKIYLGPPPLLRFFILLEAGVNLAEALLHEEV